MKYCLILLSVFSVSIVSYAAGKDSTIHYPLPDSVKAISFIADVNIRSATIKKLVAAGIRTEMVSLSLEGKKNKKNVVFDFPKSALVVARGLDMQLEKGELEWSYNWNTNETYKLMLAVATDSAGNFSLYSGYIWLPKEMKWKLIGSCKISGQWSTIKRPATFYLSARKDEVKAIINNAWSQKTNGSWKKLDDNEQQAPIVNLVSHVDSVQQYQIDKQLIEQTIASGKTDVKENIEGVYYAILNQGTGGQVALTDTVTVHYKGYLFVNGEVFDQTKEKPATFPLNRLIKGWQLVVPLLKVGGKIKIVIPSTFAYSIRPRASKIPPNSILVFEVEVLDARSIVK